MPNNRVYSFMWHLRVVSNHYYYVISFLSLSEKQIRTFTNQSKVVQGRGFEADSLPQNQRGKKLTLRKSSWNFRPLWLSIKNKVHIFWEGHKILQNLPLTFDYSTYSQKLGEDFAKFCGLLRLYIPLLDDFILTLLHHFFDLTSFYRLG